MLGNIMCWIIAFGLLLSESIDRRDMFIKLLFAMGFIFLGILSKAVDTYREVHKPVVGNSGDITPSKTAGD